jgi:hypothetical protein
MSKSCQSAANVNTFSVWSDVSFLQIIAGHSRIFSYRDKFARITPIKMAIGYVSALTAPKSKNLV